MAENNKIKQIQVGSTTYDIEDPNAAKLNEKNIFTVSQAIRDTLDVENALTAGSLQIRDSDTIEVYGRFYKFPDKDGTIALTKDIPTVPQNIVDSSATGSLKQVKDADFTLSNPNATKNGQTIESDAVGQYSTALGGKSRAEGKRSFSAGTQTIATGNYSAAFGNNSIAEGGNSLAAGLQSISRGAASFAAGSNNIAAGDNSTALGWESKANGVAAMTTGRYNQADGQASFTEGVYSKTLTSIPTDDVPGSGTGGSGGSSSGETFDLDAHLGMASHAEGDSGRAVGYGSHVQGYAGTALGHYSTVEGVRCKVDKLSTSKPHDAMGAHAGGIESVASGIAAFSFGNKNIVRGNYSTAFGINNSISGSGSFASGENNAINGSRNFIAGVSNVDNPLSQCSALIGQGLKDENKSTNPHVIIGRYNKVSHTDVGDPNYPFFQVGIGSSESDRKTGLSVQSTGRVVSQYGQYFEGGLTAFNADFKNGLKISSTADSNTRFNFKLDPTNNTGSIAFRNNQIGSNTPEGVDSCELVFPNVSTVTGIKYELPFDNTLRMHYALVSADTLKPMYMHYIYVDGSILYSASANHNLRIIMNLPSADSSVLTDNSPATAGDTLRNAMLSDVYYRCEGIYTDAGTSKSMNVYWIYKDSTTNNLCVSDMSDTTKITFGSTSNIVKIVDHVVPIGTTYTGGVIKTKTKKVDVWGKTGSAGISDEWGSSTTYYTNIISSTITDTEGDVVKIISATITAGGSVTSIDGTTVKVRLSGSSPKVTVSATITVTYQVKIDY